MKNGRVWVTWETQRRSIEMAETFGCTFYVIDIPGIFRYPRSIVQTVRIFIAEHPALIFVQNPSMLLAALAVVYCKAAGIPLVVDRHTTFLIDKPKRFSFKRSLFLALSRFTLSQADLTLVTNEHLAGLVREAGGTPFILPDPLPSFSPGHSFRCNGKGMSVVVPTSYADDEPIENIISAGAILGNEGITFYLTGNDKKLPESLRARAGTGCIFTGFLQEQEYVDLLFSVDAVLVLTTASSTMLCGCYEAVAAEKPLITSKKPCLVEYFTEALFVDNSVNEIVTSCRECRDRKEELTEKSREMKRTIAQQWSVRHRKLEEELLRVTMKKDRQSLSENRER